VLSIDDSAEPLGAWKDGRTAVARKQLGKGQAILFGCPIMDCYEYIRRPGREEDKGRFKLYKALERELGIADNSWVWDVTIDNLVNVTAPYPFRPAKPEAGIEFRDFLLQHKK